MACFVAQFQMIGPWKYMMLSIMTWWSWSAFRTFMALLSGSTNKGMSKLQHQQLTIFITWGFNSCILSYSMMKTLTFFVSFSIPFLQIHLEPVKVMKLQPCIWHSDICLCKGDYWILGVPPYFSSQRASMCTYI
jgi:hypothetical protein